MRYIDWQIDRFGEGADRPAVIWHDQIFSYADLRAAYDGWVERLAGDGVRAGDAVGVVGDFSPSSIACLLALLKLRCIAVPLAWDSRDQHATFCEIAELDWLVTLDADDAATVAPQSFRRGHELMEKLRELDEPGLVLFSSGSTGKPKAILHNLQPLLDKFRKPRHSMRTVSFLLFDHIGGFNTLLYTLANLGTVVVPRDRSVAQVCDAVQKHRAQLLPTSPSFLNLLLLGEAHRNYDLSSLELVTYGTEVMPERTLVMLGEALPNARLQQTYGLSELGILRSKSASNQSLLVKVGGEDYETRVVDGTLHIRARSSMLGYLNAPSPFDADGWFNTGDAVIQEGEYYRILGRKSEII
ncbi:MAG TPA: long-chain fatty acid--CoA ligase, partial [Rhodothermales bacterium]